MRSIFIFLGFFLFSTLLPVSALAKSKPWQPLEEYAFPALRYDGRSGPRTNSVLVWKQDRLLFERYARGYSAEKLHALWSISKSVTALVFGIAETKGLVSRTDSICRFAEHIPKEHCDIRFQDLIQWTSGLDWLEEYENSKRVTKSSVVNMLYGDGHKDMRKFVLAHKKAAKPGSIWRYSSGDSHVLASLLPDIFEADSVDQMFIDHLFNPLQMQRDWSPAIERDGAGRPVGASNMFFNPNFLVSIGRLLINDGVGPEGKRLLSKDFIGFIQTVPDAFKTNRKDHDENIEISGGSFWLNKAAGTGMEKPWPAAPDDTIVAKGHWGQYLVVIPSLKLVIVRHGDTRDKSFQLSEFLSIVLKAVSDEKK